MNGVINNFRYFLIIQVSIKCLHNFASARQCWSYNKSWIILKDIK